MSDNYTPIDPAFCKVLRELVAQRASVRLQFYTDIHEFITRHATFKELLSRGDEQYLVLTTGEEVRLDRVVRVNDKPAPGYNEDFFKCDLGR